MLLLKILGLIFPDANFGGLVYLLLKKIITICNVNGKIVKLLGNVSLVEVIMVNSPSYLKQWHHKTCGF